MILNRSYVFGIICGALAGSLLLLAFVYTLNRFIKELKAHPDEEKGKGKGLKSQPKNNLATESLGATTGTRPQLPTGASEDSTFKEDTVPSKATQPNVVRSAAVSKIVRLEDDNDLVMPGRDRVREQHQRNAAERLKKKLRRISEVEECRLSQTRVPEMEVKGIIQNSVEQVPLNASSRKHIVL